VSQRYISFQHLEDLKYNNPLLWTKTRVVPDIELEYQVLENSLNVHPFDNIWYNTCFCGLEVITVLGGNEHTFGVNSYIIIY